MSLSYGYNDSAIHDAHKRQDGRTNLELLMREFLDSQNGYLDHQKICIRAKECAAVVKDIMRAIDAALIRRDSYPDSMIDIILAGARFATVQRQSVGMDVTLWSIGRSTPTEPEEYSLYIDQHGTLYQRVGVTYEPIKYASHRGSHPQPDKMYQLLGNDLSMLEHILFNVHLLWKEA